MVRYIVSYVSFLCVLVGLVSKGDGTLHSWIRPVKVSMETAAAATSNAHKQTPSPLTPGAHVAIWCKMQIQSLATTAPTLL